MRRGFPKHDCRCSDHRRRMCRRLPGGPPHHPCSAHLVGLALVADLLDAVIPATLPMSRQLHSPLQHHHHAPSHVSNRKIHPNNQPVVGSNPRQNSPTLPSRNERASSKSIFTLSSSPHPLSSTLHKDVTYNCPSFTTTTTYCFTSICFLCRRPLLPSNDIYMYRGDQAYCTKQCRQHQMLIDEQKEKSSSKRDPPPQKCCFKSGNTPLHCRIARNEERCMQARTLRQTS